MALTKAGKELIDPIFRKHSAEIDRLFSDATPRELQVLESVLKKAGKRAEALAAEKKCKQNDQESVRAIGYE